MTTIKYRVKFRAVFERLGEIGTTTEVSFDEMQGYASDAIKAEFDDASEIEVLSFERIPEIKPVLNWESALTHLQIAEDATRQLANVRGVNIHFYAGVLSTLRSRYDKGERTKELYDEIMEMN